MLLLKCSYTDEKCDKYVGYKSIFNSVIMDKIMCNTPDKDIKNHRRSNALHKFPLRNEKQKKNVFPLVRADSLK